MSRAEALFVDAKKPELALRAYMEVRRYPEALRVAKAHLPHRYSHFLVTTAYTTSHSLIIILYFYLI